jgi:cell fate (sporulation/competence/biofilm development) regulator YlbF (YheA/YmcA/DUF963 family)
VNIIEQAKQLGEAILATPEYKSFQAAKAEMENDVEAGKLLDTLQERRQALHEVRLAGGDVKEEADKLWSHQRQMLENKAISEYLDRKRDVEKLLADVNNVLAQAAGMEAGRPAGGCGGSCG